LFENVSPNTRRRVPNDSRLCKVLAMAMLWCACDGEAAEKYLSPMMRQRITAAYIPTHPNTAQPINKVALNIYGIQDTLMIDKIPNFNNGTPPNAAAGEAASGGGGRGSSQQTRQQNADVLVNLQRLTQQQAQNHLQAMDSIAGLQTWAANQFKTVNNNI
jgi:hypothetical protein